MAYEHFDLKTFADWARASNPELGWQDNTLVNYYSGKVVARFDDHEGEGAEDTAKFLASARSIVLELVNRVQALQDKHNAALDQLYPVAPMTGMDNDLNLWLAEFIEEYKALKEQLELQAGYSAFLRVCANSGEKPESFEWYVQKTLDHRKQSQ